MPDIFDQIAGQNFMGPSAPPGGINTDIFDHIAGNVDSATSIPSSADSGFIGPQDEPNPIRDAFSAINAQYSQPTESPMSRISSIWDDIKGTPAAAMNLVKSIPSAATSLYNLPGQVLSTVENANEDIPGNISDADKAIIQKKLAGEPLTPQEDLRRAFIKANILPQAAQQAGLQTTGAENTLTGVGDLASMVASSEATGGGIAGNSVGAASGNTAFQKLLQAVGVNAPTTATQDVRDFQRNTVQGGLLSAGLKPIEMGISKTIGPQTELSAAQTAAETLGNISGKTGDDVASAIAANVTDPLASTKTSAELLGSPKLATLDQAMGTVKPMEMAASAGDRATTTDNVLSSIAQDTSALKENTGSTILDAFNTAKQASKDNVETLVKPLYGAAYQNVPLIKDPALQTLLGKDQVLNSAIKAVQKTANNVDLPVNSVELLVKARSEIGNKIEQAISKGSGREARDLTDTYNRLNDVLHKNPLLESADSAYADAIGKHNETFNQGPLSKLSNTQGSQVIGNILSSPEAATKAADIIGNHPQAIQAVKDQIGTDLLNMTDVKRIAYINSKESQLKSLLPRRDYEILDAIRNDAQLRIDTAKSANPTGGSNTALKSLSLPSVIGRSIKSKEAAPTGVWGQLVNATLKGSGTLAGGLATYTHPYVAVPALAATAIVKGLRDRSAGLVQDALFKQLKDPEALASALKSNAAKKPSILSDALGKVISSSTIAANSKPVTQDTLNQLLSTVLNKGGTKMDNVEAPKVLAAERVPATSKDEAMAKIKADPTALAIAMTESNLKPDLSNIDAASKAKNPDSTAEGLYQFVDKTAKSLGLKDKTDIPSSVNAFETMTEQNQKIIGSNDPDATYLAHVLGAPLAKKVLNQTPLTSDEQKEVNYFFVPNKDGKSPYLNFKKNYALALAQSGQA